MNVRAELYNVATPGSRTGAIHNLGTTLRRLQRHLHRPQRPSGQPCASSSSRSRPARPSSPAASPTSTRSSRTSPQRHRRPIRPERSRRHRGRRHAGRSRLDRVDRQRSGSRATRSGATVRLRDRDRSPSARSRISDTGLAGNTTYTYKVSAIDAAGNESAQSVAAVATTAIANDTVAPTVPGRRRDRVLRGTASPCPGPRPPTTSASPATRSSGRRRASPSSRVRSRPSPTAPPPPRPSTATRSRRATPRPRSAPHPVRRRRPPRLALPPAVETTTYTYDACRQPRLTETTPDGITAKSAYDRAGPTPRGRQRHRHWRHPVALQLCPRSRRQPHGHDHHPRQPVLQLRRRSTASPAVCYDASCAGSLTPVDMHRLRRLAGRDARRDDHARTSPTPSPTGPTTRSATA